MKRALGLGLVAALFCGLPARAAPPLTDAQAAAASDPRDPPDADPGSAPSSGRARGSARGGTEFAFGPGFLANLGAGVGYAFHLAHFWDAGWLTVRLQGDFTTDGNAFMGGAAIGGDYFYLNRDIAPYSGIDFGMAGAKAAGGSIFLGESAFGFDLGVSSGVRLLYLSNVNLDIAARASILLRTLSAGLPFAFTLRFGICF